MLCRFLEGQGIARQRQAIIAGLKDSVLNFESGVTDVNSRDVIEMMVRLGSVIYMCLDSLTLLDPLMCRKCLCKSRRTCLDFSWLKCTKLQRAYQINLSMIKRMYQWIFSIPVP